MDSKSENRYFTPFCFLVAFVTWCVIWVGGLVTSHGAGMAVADWPNTYGYNMFFFPFSQWMGGIFYEHSHRQIASLAGFLVTILLIWTYGRRSRGLLRGAGILFLLVGLGLLFFSSGVRRQDGIMFLVIGLLSAGAGWFAPLGEPMSKNLRRAAWIAFGLVAFQGLLGGLRVVLVNDQIGVFHGTLAQLFFAFVCVIACSTTRWWQRTGELIQASRGLKTLLTVTLVLMVIQLILGASMRHQHAGLAIPDFPKAHGEWWPDMTEAAVASYNLQRTETVAMKPITAFQIALQMVHRIVAVLIVVCAGVIGTVFLKKIPRGHPLARAILFWGALIALQVVLGAATIWSGKAADMATAHVAVGALSLAVLSVARVLVARAPVSLPMAAQVKQPLFNIAEGSRA